MLKVNLTDFADSFISFFWEFCFYEPLRCFFYGCSVMGELLNCPAQVICFFLSDGIQFAQALGLSPVV